MSITGNYSLTGSYMPASAIPAGMGTNGYSTSSFGSATPSDSFISSAYPTGTPAPSTMGTLVQDMLTMMEMMMGVIANQLQSGQGSSITGGSSLNTGSTATGNPVTASIYSYYNQDDPTLAHIDDPPPQPAPDDSGDGE